MGNRSVRCPYCGAQFEAPETASLLVCPYCGTAFWRRTSEPLKEHYIFDPRYSVNKAFDYIKKTVSRQFAAPRDLEEEAELNSAYLHYVPLYLYHVLVRGECPENPEAGLEDRYESRLALSNPPRWIPSSYRFPVRGRRFFEPRKIEKGRYHSADLDPKQLLEAVSKDAVREARREAEYTCDSPRIVNETTWEGIMHYPFWEIRYSYGDNTYTAVLDAASGEVTLAEYPQGTRERGAVGLLAVGGTIGAIVLGTLLGGGVGHAAAGAAGAFIASTPSLAILARRSMSSKQKYVGERLRASRK